MKVKMMQVGPIGTNCYILEDEKKIAVIDPGDEAERILEVREETEGTVAYILLTHGHYDHTTAVPALHRVYPGAEAYIHRADADGVGSRIFPLSGEMEGLKFYDEGDSLPLGGLTIHVMHTPGHSPGSVVLRVEDVLFCGDTLFAGSMGRTDLPGGSEEQIMESLRRLGALEGNFHVLPGHMGASDLDQERKHNPYLRMAMG